MNLVRSAYREWRFPKDLIAVPIGKIMNQRTGRIYGKQLFS